MSVPEYWRKVLSGAWDRTYNPLGWNAKKVAVVLIAVGTIVAADVHLGLAAMITSAVGYLWIAVPVAFAAIILFVWGFLQTTASLCADLGNTSRTTISELEAALAQYQKPAPDYEAWRHVDRLTLREAAFLWCDLSPGPSMPPNVQAWFNALSSAIQRGGEKTRWCSNRSAPNKVRATSTSCDHEQVILPDQARDRGAGQATLLCAGSAAGRVSQRRRERHE